MEESVEYDSPHPFLRGLSSVSQLCLFVTPWTIAHWALLSMEFSKQEYWSGLPFPSLEGNSFKYIHTHMHTHTHYTHILYTHRKKSRR